MAGREGGLCGLRAIWGEGLRGRQDHSPLPAGGSASLPFILKTVGGEGGAKEGQRLLRDEGAD